MTAILKESVAGREAFRKIVRVSVAEAAAKSLVIRSPGGYNGPWSPDETPYMVEPMNTLASRIHEAVCFVGPSRTGKALDVDTPIPTPTGWTTMGALQVGDTIISPDGKPTTVVFVTEYQNNRPCFRVTFSDGESVVADADHRWGVDRFYWREPNYRYEVRTTSEIATDLLLKDGADGRKRFRYRIRNTAPIDFEPADLPIDPYLLGLWLGDGSSAAAYISCHAEDAAHYVDRFERAGHSVSVIKDGEQTVFVRVDMRYRLTTHCQRGHEFSVVGKAKNGGCMECLRLGHWRRKYGKDRDGNEVPPLSLFAGTFSSQLHALGVHGNKHIPLLYLRASIEQRWELLRGLMDTDGYAGKRQASAEFVTTLPALRDGFCELARSLGLRPTAKEKRTSWEYKGEKKNGVAYRVTFPIPRGVVPFSLARKVESFKTTANDVGYRQIVSIEPVQSRPVKCIQVDNPSHMFLAGHAMIPTHNTQGLLDGFLTYAATCDPGDMLIVQQSQEKSREYSKTRVDRAIRHSPDLQALMTSNASDHNTHDILFRHGMWLRIGWPTVTQLSGSDYRYVALTDYDRMPENIDGEGDAYALALKRTQTFLSRGMCVVESSPGYPITDPHWKPATRHEAPPCTGILGVYNRSDRRRWYWPCPHCDEYFEAAPGVGLFNLPADDVLLEAVRHADLEEIASQHSRIVCPVCGAEISRARKADMNLRGKWVADGQIITPGGRVEGDPMRSNIAGFWMGGVAAAYQSWHSLVMRYLQGMREYALSGSELSLQTTTNTDQGAPYISRILVDAARGSSGPDGRKDDSIERFIVPEWTRFVVASVDVQGGQGARFVVQVHAVGEHLETCPVDRYAITESTREGVDGNPAPIDPASYAEDWNTLRDMILLATYRTPRDGREIRVKMMAIDSGGEDGVTDKAYAFYRRMRAEQFAGRVMLVKGASTKTAPLIKESWVGGKRHGEKGDVPIYLLNTNQIKDAVSAGLRRSGPGGGYIHAPAWLPASWFDELTAEIRRPDGTWSKVRKRNEAFDLLCYCRAVCIKLGADRPAFWQVPPDWARPLESNALIITRDERRALQSDVPAAEIRRRVTRSSYLR